MPTPPNLQPPGKGLPAYELFIGRLMVRFKLRHISPEVSLREFSEERERIISLVTSIPPELASQQVLIKRLRGLEDSSRFWSVYMTLDHLRIVNQSITNVVSTLLKGSKPELVVSTAAVKPTPGIGAEALSEFAAVCDDFQRRFRTDNNMKTAVTLAHPWFGELNGEQWHFFAGFHMKLHRKQIEAIISKLMGRA